MDTDPNPNPNSYCNSYYSFSRFSTREVYIGDVPMGAGHPVRVQSMTSVPSGDVVSTVRQILDLYRAGCEYVRLAVPGLREAEHLPEIMKSVRSLGCPVPLIADVHYLPGVAELAARSVEKVRINPGNFTDRPGSGRQDRSDRQYREALERVEERLIPLINICRRERTALRIGANHGSLAPRILYRYGGTPEGLVESVLEFARICVRQSFFNVVVSLKASDVGLMVRSNRLLVHAMMKEGMNWPVHLGVTEAGDEDEGRIRSAAGIGSLLLDGIGDTIRVSLTEDPVREIPVARDLLSSITTGRLLDQVADGEPPWFSPFQEPKASVPADASKPVVIASAEEKDLAGFRAKGLQLLPDYFVHPASQGALLKTEFSSGKVTGRRAGRIIPCASSHNGDSQQDDLLLMTLSPSQEGLGLPVWGAPAGKGAGLILDAGYGYAGTAHLTRRICRQVHQAGINIPVILKISPGKEKREVFLVKSSAIAGSLLTDHLITGLWLDSAPSDAGWLTELSFGILQATGARLTRTVFIACPSCGRTTFDIQSVLKRVKERTSHLVGLKIAVMGCMVNGPGEMAGAEWGYVGSGKNRVTIYRGNHPVLKNIPEKNAVDELVRLIRESGEWHEPETV
ncbi:MAG: (E)-4-hydroxy-3-methylbut-2-enyl-diphosphate synthase [Bacteroidales bacterium]|nr:(E)-4-hydroxy-3-methylbut-2-enyl-diphosphate synthase [Bacteroidales bacterium]